MKITIVGAGSVGLSLAARLARAECDVTILTRSAATAAEIATSGVEVLDPSSEERFRARPRAAAGFDSLADDGHTILLCVRAPDTDAVLGELARVAPSSVVACAQNDVDNEARAARWFQSVVGVVVRQTCTRTSATTTSALGAGRIALGAYNASSGATSTARDAALRLGAAFAAARFDVGLSQDIEADKWLKLCVNLMSVPNALIAPDEHATRDFVEIKSRILEEAREVLQRAGIRAASCDGRDRSLDDEIAFQRSSLERGDSARRLPIYNAVWGSLHHGSPLEAERYHERILGLARLHSVDAPMNARSLELVLRAQRDGLGPESLQCRDFLRS